MAKLNAIKYWYGFILLLATISFAGCTDDNEDTEAPYLEVSPTTLSFTAEGAVAEGSQSYFEISTNRNWTITVQDSKDWVTFSKTSGEGSAKIDVSVPAGTADEAKVDIQISNKSGVLLSKTVTIVRGVSETVEEVVIYNETLGETKVSENTAVENFTDWDNKNVTYTGSSDKMQVRVKSSGGYINASGGNAFFFGTGPASLTIGKIALTSEQTKLKLTFGANSYDYNTQSDSFDETKFLVYLSADGTNWTALTYSRDNGDEKSPNWVFATANFTLKSAISELYIKFAPTTASLFSLDDITLSTGIGGTEIDLSGSNSSAETTSITIAELLEKGKALASGSSAIIDENNNRTFEGVVQTTAAGANNNNTLAVAVEGATEAGNGITLYSYDLFNASKLTVTTGDKVKITLKANNAKMQNYNGWYEIAGDGEFATIEKLEGTATITPIEITSDNIANLADYQGMTVTVNGVTAKEESGTWCTSSSNSSTTFSLNGTDFYVYCYKASVFADQIYANKAEGGTITGVVSVYNSGQILPRTLDDVSDFISNAPYISGVSPTTLTFPLSGGTEAITVTGSNLDGVTLTCSGVSSPITATVEGTTITVTVSETSNATTQTLIITATGGNSQEVTINIEEASEPTISVDFTDSNTYPDDFPSSSKTAVTGENEYTFSEYTFKIYASGGYYKNSGYLFLKENGCYIEFPAIENKKLTKVVASNASGTSTSLAMAIQDTEGSTVSGGEAQTWSTQSSSYTYKLSNTSNNTAYRIINTSTKNAQFSKLELYYE